MTLFKELTMLIMGCIGLISVIFIWHLYLMSNLNETMQEHYLSEEIHTLNPITNTVVYKEKGVLCLSTAVESKLASGAFTFLYNEEARATRDLYVFFIPYKIKIMVK